MSRLTEPKQSIYTLNEEDYEIVSVEPTDPPGDMVGTGWHCYVIEQGKRAMEAQVAYLHRLLATTSPELESE